MAQLIKPVEATVITKNGECKLNITLDLNININSGALEFTTKQNDTIDKNTEEKDRTEWVIPDFSPTSKLQFGKKE